MISALWILKCFLKHVESLEPERVFDLGIGAYLLNPLKSSYTYEDIAGEYIGGISIPSREELWKDTHEKSLGKSSENLGNLCLLSGVYCLCCQGETEAELKETGMWQVYTDIELPLVFWIPWKMRNLRKRRGTESIWRKTQRPDP